MSTPVVSTPDTQTSWVVKTVAALLVIALTTLLGLDRARIVEDSKAGLDLARRVENSQTEMNGELKLIRLQLTTIQRQQDDLLTELKKRR